VTAASSIRDRRERRRLLASPRFRIALLLFGLNVVLGLPAALLIAGFAALVGAKWLGLVGGLAIYAGSWILLAVAVLIGGQEVVVHGSWLIRRWLEKRRGR